MLDTSLFEASRWIAENGSAALGGAFIWGVLSALLSPCHLGVIPLFGHHTTEDATASSAPHRPVTDVLRFVCGYLALFPLLGGVLVLFGRSLEFGGHYWTIPVGLLFGWIGIDMMRGHGCSSVSHVLASMARKLNVPPALGLFVMGAGYSLLSSGCSGGFLMPLILAGMGQGVFFCVALAFFFGVGHSLPMIVVGCSASLAARHVHEHQHTPHESGKHGDPHIREARFRKVMGAVLLVIAILFIMHPFIEHAH